MTSTSANVRKNARPDTAIRSTADFSAESLRALGAGEIDLIWHRAFYPRADCAAVLPAIVQACAQSSYTLTKDLQSLGTSMGEAAQSADLAARYLDTAAATTRLIRERIFGGRVSPCDRLRLLADEYWPAGATVARHNGQPMLPGIIRRWTESGHANPHIDQRDVPLLVDYRLTRRIGINVYLETPEAGHGGELEFWAKITDEQTYLRRKRADYGLDRELLGEPAEVIAPGQGDLLMFDAARVHGVRRVSRGSRVTAACFFGVRTPTDPLIVFA